MSPNGNGQIGNWVKIGITILVMSVTMVVYIHTNFTSVGQYNRDQDRIEHRLDNIQKDIREILRRTR